VQAAVWYEYCRVRCPLTQKFYVLPSYDKCQACGLRNDSYPAASQEALLQGLKDPESDVSRTWDQRAAVQGDQRLKTWKRDRIFQGADRRITVEYEVFAIPEEDYTSYP
jgi:hypothetical protein